MEKSRLEAGAPGGCSRQGSRGSGAPASSRPGNECSRRGALGRGDLGAGGEARILRFLVKWTPRGGTRRDWGLTEYGE